MVSKFLLVGRLLLYIVNARNILLVLILVSFVDNFYRGAILRTYLLGVLQLVSEFKLLKGFFLG